MSLESLRNLISACESNPTLWEKIRHARDLEEFSKFALEAGFEVSPADWLKHQAEQVLELSDEELDQAVGGSTAAITMVAETVLATTDVATIATPDGPSQSGAAGSYQHTVC